MYEYRYLTQKELSSLVGKVLTFKGLAPMHHSKRLIFKDNEYWFKWCGFVKASSCPILMPI